MRTVSSNSPSGPNTLNLWSKATVRRSRSTAIRIELVLRPYTVHLLEVRIEKAVLPGQLDHLLGGNRDDTLT